MNNIINVKIKSKFIQEYQDKYPLIEREIFEDVGEIEEEGTILNLITTNNKFIGRGYFGKQNKGYGWVLTYDKNETIDTAFFIKKIKEAVAHRKDFYEDAKNNITTAFRVLNGEGDGLGGLTIDYFDGYYMLTWYSVGMYT
ncbi:MAG: 23S rRNA (cytosine1962-C5)-methyltransferase, partial [Arcobacteraceae bacterium]